MHTQCLNWNIASSKFSENRHLKAYKVAIIQFILGIEQEKLIDNVGEIKRITGDEDI